MDALGDFGGKPDVADAKRIITLFDKFIDEDDESIYGDTDYKSNIAFVFQSA